MPGIMKPDAVVECADKALQIADLVEDLRFQPDRIAIQEVIEATTVDLEMSDSQLHVTTSAVVDALKRPVD